MAAIFPAKPGSVAIIPGAQLPMQISLQGWQGAQAMRAVLIHMQANESVAAQFTPALQPFIHIFTFGDAMGDLVLGGYAFAQMCGTGNGAATGFEMIRAYYNAHKLSQRATPLSIQIGLTRDGSMSGFLVAMQHQTVDPLLGLTQFSLAFKLLPELLRAP